MTPMRGRLRTNKDGTGRSAVKPRSCFCGSVLGGAGNRYAVPVFNQSELLMDLRDFFVGNDRVEKVEIISFSIFPPRLLLPKFVTLTGFDHRAVYLTTEMHEVHERLEIGVLKFWEGNDPSKSGTKVLLSGGRVLSWNYLAAPGYDFISGARVKLDSGDLVVTAGAMPLSVFVSFGHFRAGDPECPVDQYTDIV